MCIEYVIVEISAFLRSSGASGGDLKKTGRGRKKTDGPISRYKFVKLHVATCFRGRGLIPSEMHCFFLSSYCGPSNRKNCIRPELSRMRVSNRPKYFTSRHSSMRKRLTSKPEKLIEKKKSYLISSKL